MTKQRMKLDWFYMTYPRIRVDFWNAWMLNKAYRKVGEKR